MHSEALIQRITDEIDNGTLINKDLFAHVDAKRLYNQRYHKGSRCVAAAAELDRLAGEKASHENLKLPESVATSVIEAANNKAIESSGARESNRDLEWFWIFIEQDFRKIAKCVCFNIEHPLLNGLWTFYRAGRIPSAWLEIPGTFEEIFDISREDALKFVEPAEKAAEDAIAAFVREREEFDADLAATEGLPSERVIKYLLALNGYSEPDLRILFTENELSGVELPRTWRELLAAQWNNQPVPWSKLWNEQVAKVLPAVMKRLEKHCLGLAVMTRSGSPRHSSTFLLMRTTTGKAGKAIYSLSAVRRSVPKTRWKTRFKAS